MRDVVVLGWWHRSQDRISYIKLLVSIGWSLKSAADSLNANLRDGRVTVIPVSPPERADEIGAAIQAMGAEARVLEGHTGEGGDRIAQRQLAEIERVVAEFGRREIGDWRTRAAAAAGLLPELLPRGTALGRKH